MSTPIAGPRRSVAVALVALAVWLAPAAAAAQVGAPVAVAPAERREIVHVVRLSGSVVAPRTSRVSTAIGGLVERIAVELGERVPAGATLVVLDGALARHEVERADAAVDEARATLADARRRVRVAKRLAQRNNIPQTELDAREAAARQAAAAVDRLRAEAAMARERLGRHTIDAPFAGVVAARATEAGEWVSPGTTLVRLVAIDELYVDVRVPQAHFSTLRHGAPIDLRFDALPGRTVAGEVAAVVPVSDPTARTFTLRVRPQAEGELPLTPGMSARVRIRLSTGRRDVVVPRGAVIRYPDGRTTVWVVDDEGGGGPRARERQVGLGRAFDGLVQVERGLEAGSAVVVRGNETLRPGQRVRITDGSG